MTDAAQTQPARSQGGTEMLLSLFRRPEGGAFAGLVIIFLFFGYEYMTNICTFR